MQQLRVLRAPLVSTPLREPYHAQHVLLVKRMRTAIRPHHVQYVLQARTLLVVAQRAYRVLPALPTWTRGQLRLAPCALLESTPLSHRHLAHSVPVGLLTLTLTRPQHVQYVLQAGTLLVVAQSVYRALPALPTWTLRQLHLVLCALPARSRSTVPLLVIRAQLERPTPTVTLPHRVSLLLTTMSVLRVRVLLI